MMKFILLILLFLPLAHASEITRAFTGKRYDLIAMRYRAQPNKNYTNKELVMISQALRNMKFYRDDIALNLKLISKGFSKQHRQLVSQIKAKKTVNPDQYHAFQKGLYWNIFSNYGILIQEYPKKSQALEEDLRQFQMFQKILSELEHREGEADRLGDQVAAHITYLSDVIYRFSASWSVKYISWQRGAELTRLDNNLKADLILTNAGTCFGGDVGIENNFNHFYLDGCMLVGAGGVSAYGDPLLTYRQANVPAYGFKAGVGASRIVSSSKSRIGLRVPIVYTVQNLTAPSGYSVSDSATLGIFTTLYSRWHFGKWYFETEFGRNVSSIDSLWSLGLGRSF
jgi:hypothetical protein